MSPHHLANPDASPLDLSLFDDLRADRDSLPEGFLTGLIDQVLGEVTARIADLKDADRRQDAAACLRHAHRLKGSAGTVGAHRMATMCEALEVCGESGDLSRAAMIIAQLEEEFSRVVPALDRERQREITGER
jgi:HPt (histidine-containing phosphotransfer) domain-containing protein